MLIEVKVRTSKKERESIKNLLNRIEASIGKKTSFPEYLEGLKKKKRIVIKYNMFSFLTGSIKIAFPEEYITDMIQLYSDPVISVILFARTMNIFHDQDVELQKKWLIGYHEEKCELCGEKFVVPNNPFRALMSNCCPKCIAKAMGAVNNQNRAASTSEHVKKGKLIDLFTHMKGDLN